MKIFTKIRRWLENIRLARIGRLFYYLRAHTYNRYHIIDISNLDPDYKWGWIDTDHKMFYAMFKLFQDFMETEYEHGFVDWDANYTAENFPDEASQAWVADARKRHQEMKDIYTWWKTDRFEENKLLDELLMAGYSGEGEPKFIEREGKTFMEFDAPDDIVLVRDIHRIYEEVLEEKEQQMLHRLIDIRHTLWT
jgi:hypothetical protein